MLKGLRQLSVYRIADNGTKMWFFNQEYRAIIEIDKSTMKPHIIWFHEGENLFKQREYGGITCDNDRLIFAPRCTDKILIYGFDKGDMILIPLDRKKARGLSAVFSDVCIHEGNAFFFPGRFRAITKMNLETYEIQYIDGWVNDIGHLRDDCSIFSKGKIFSEGTCLLPCWQKGIILEFSMDNLSWKIHEICEGGISDVIRTEDGYWIIQKDTCEIIQTDNRFEIVGRYKFAHEKLNVYKGFLFAIRGNEELFLFPFREAFIVKFDERKKEFSCIAIEGLDDNTPVHSDQHMQIRNLYISKYNENLHILFNTLRGNLLFFNSIDGVINEFPLILDETEFKEISADWEYKYFKEDIRKESKTIGLDDFISFIKGAN